MIYADNAATTKLDMNAFEAMKHFLIEDYSNVSQRYSFSRKAKKALKEARSSIANCIGATPDEIFFTSGGTESDNWAIKGMMKYGEKQSILTSQIEHHAILNACAFMEKMGNLVSYLPVDKHGIVSPEILRKYITDKTKLISIMLVNNEIGSIEPIKELAKLAHEQEVLFHTDAVQAIGHIPINVEELGVDMLSGSGHKFNGPKGVGFLYIRKDTKINSYADGGTQEFGMRAGTENVAAIVAMAKALELNCLEMSNTNNKLIQMEASFIQILNEAGVDYIRNGAEQHVPGNINISIRGISGEMLFHRLDLKGICISTGSACNSESTQISHVIRSIGAPSEYAEGTIRISFGRDNDKKDSIEVAKAIVNILKS